MPAAVKGRDPHFIDMAQEYGEINRPAHGILLSLDLSLVIIHLLLPKDINFLL